jgi:hypothetical protein
MILPRGWGIAWPCPNEMRYVIMPIPFHVIAGFIRAQWHNMIVNHWPDEIEGAYQRGWDAAMKQYHQYSRHRETRVF